MHPESTTELDLTAEPDGGIPSAHADIAWPWAQPALTVAIRFGNGALHAEVRLGHTELHMRGTRRAVTVWRRRVDR
jgi:hypothetical protein